MVALAALTLVGTTACSGGDGEETEPAEPAPVALSPDGVPDDLSIGVLVSLSSPDDQGSQWREAAEGAQVAAYRYGLADVDVTLVPADDRGTEQGAEAAVSRLVDKGVSGIVVATEGDHLDQALQAAAEADVPVLTLFSYTTLFR